MELSFGELLLGAEQGYPSGLGRAVAFQPSPSVRNCSMIASFVSFRAGAEEIRTLRRCPLDTVLAQHRAVPAS